jgi:hypothetical protein
VQRDLVMMTKRNFSDSKDEGSDGSMMSMPLRKTTWQCIPVTATIESPHPASLQSSLGGLDDLEERLQRVKGEQEESTFNAVT